MVSYSDLTSTNWTFERIIYMPISAEGSYFYIRPKTSLDSTEAKS